MCFWGVVGTDLEAERQLVNPRGESSNLPVRKHPGVVRVYLVKHLGDVQLLLSAHQEVKVGEGKLHVFGVAHTVAGCLVELSREAEDGAQY